MRNMPNTKVRELDVIAVGNTDEHGCEEREVEGPVAMSTMTS
jgi:hypothetical protein